MWQRQHWQPPEHGQPHTGELPQFAQYAAQPDANGQWQYQEQPQYVAQPEAGAQQWQQQPAQYSAQPQSGGQWQYYEQPQYVAQPEAGAPWQYREQPQYGVPGSGEQTSGEYQYHYAPPEYGGQQYGQAGYAPPLYGGAQLFGQSAPEAPEQQVQPAAEMPLSRPPRRNRIPLIVGSLVVVALLAVAGFVVWKRFSSHDVSSTATSSSAAPQPATSSAPTSGTPVASGAIPRRPEANPPHDGTPGLVAGPTFGPTDPVYLMDLTGLPFKFDVPAGWSCMPSSKMRADFLTAWTCYDSNVANGPGGLVAVQTCPSPCGLSDQAKLRAMLPVDAGDWRTIDPATMYAEETGTLTDGGNKGAEVDRVAMTYVFAANPGGPLDSMAFAQFTGPPSSKLDMQKVVNEVRARAGGT